MRNARTGALNALARSMPATARMLADDMDLEIHFGAEGFAAAKDENGKHHLYIPSIPDEDEDAKAIALGGQIHEDGHFKDTNFDIYSENVVLQRVTNICEDIFIEWRQMQRFAGARGILSRMLSAMQKKGQMQGVKDETSIAQIFFVFLSHTMRSRILGQTMLENTGARAEDLLRGVIGDQAVDAMQLEMGKVLATTATSDRRDIAEKILAILRDAMSLGDEQGENQESKDSDGQQPQGDDPSQGDGQQPQGDSSSQGDGQQPQGDSSSQGDGQQPQGDSSSQGDGQQPQGDDPSQGDGKQPQGDSSSQGDGQQPQGEGSSQGDGQQPQGEGSSQGDGQQPQGDDPSQGDGHQPQGDDPSQGDGKQPQGDSSSQGDGQQPQGATGQMAKSTNTTAGSVAEKGNAVGEKADDGTESALSALDIEQLEGLLGDLGEVEGDIGSQVAEVLNNLDVVDNAMVNMPETVDLDFDLGSGEDILARLRAETNAVRRKMLGLLEADAISSISFGRTGNRLDPKRLWRLKSGDCRVFEKRIEGHEQNTAIQILVDRSGSMNKACRKPAGLAEKIQRELADSKGQSFEPQSRTTTRINMAMDAGLAVAMALEGVKGVQTSVAAFPCSREGKNVAEDVLMITDFGDQVRKTAARFPAVGVEGCTPMAEALLWSVYHLHSSAKERKILLVLTDGKPDDVAKATEMLDLLEGTGIEVIGIGIQCDVSTLFNQSGMINDLNDLAPVMFRALQKQLLKRAA